MTVRWTYLAAYDTAIKQVGRLNALLPQWEKCDEPTEKKKSRNASGNSYTGIDVMGHRLGRGFRLF
jgi:hypothetical protein